MYVIPLLHLCTFIVWFTKKCIYSVLCSVVKLLLSFLCISQFHVCFVLHHSTAVKVFFVFVNFSNVHVFFAFNHVQFFVSLNFINVLQVLVMYLNLQVYLFSFFIFIGCVFVLWYFAVIVIATISFCSLGCSVFMLARHSFLVVF